MIEVTSNTISGIVEKVELERKGILNLRDNCIPHFTGVGGPDLCYLCKVRCSKTEVREGYFHWVQGIQNDLPSLSAYYAKLLLNQEKVWIFKDPYRVEFCLFCCYNGFRKWDVRIKLGGPNSDRIKFYPKVKAITNNGIRLKNVEKEKYINKLWEELVICSWLRNIVCYPSYISPLHICNNHITVEQEEEIIELSKTYCLQGYLLGTNENEQPDHFNNVLIKKAEYFFLHSLRYQHYSNYFVDLTQYDVGYFAFVAKIERKKRNFVSSNEILDTTLKSIEEKDYPLPIILEKIILLLLQNKYQEAFSITSFYLPLFPLSSQLLLYHCRALIGQGMFGEALQTLNTIIFPENPKNADVYGCKNVLWKYETKPILTQQKDESNNILYSSIKIHTDSLSKGDLKIYKILLAIYNKHGLQAFFKLFYSVFLHKHEDPLRVSLPKMPCYVPPTINIQEQNLHLSESFSPSFQAPQQHRIPVNLNILRIFEFLKEDIECVTYWKTVLSQPKREKALFTNNDSLYYLMQSTKRIGDVLFLNNLYAECKNIYPSNKVNLMLLSHYVSTKNQKEVFSLCSALLKNPNNTKEVNFELYRLVSLCGFTSVNNTFNFLSHEDNSLHPAIAQILQNSLKYQTFDPIG